MTTSVKTVCLKWMIAGLALTLVVGCSNANPVPKPESTSQTAPSSTPPAPTATQTTDTAKALLVNMKHLAEQGKVINSDFSVKTTALENVKSKWGEPEKTEWVAAAKGTYATYSNRAVIFGYNKGFQIFEVRSLDQQLQKLSLAKTKEVYGTTAYDVKVNGEEIIGYKAGQEFKIEFVFPLPTASNADPMMNHYQVLYPAGTVNSMADDPGRQW